MIYGQLVSLSINNQPIHWLQCNYYRACDLCIHGRPAAAGRECARNAKRLPVEQARRPGGPCGPDAAHLNFGDGPI